MRRPSCLGRNAVELVKHTLGTGTVMLLARGGAWTSQRHLRDGQIRDSFCDAAQRAGRRELCRLLLEAMSRLAAGNCDRNQWIASLDTSDLRLAERAEVYKSASALLRAGTRFRKWHHASLGVGFLDEGYAESQIWKSLWESLALTEAMDHADRIIQELSP